MTSPSQSDNKRAADILYSSSKGQNPEPGTARIELHYFPINHRAHALLRKVNANGIEELHGMAFSRQTGEETAMGMDGSRLSTTHEFREKFEGKTKEVGEVVSGSEQEIERIWERGKRAAKAIAEDPKTFDYKAHDPAFEFGGNGGQIQNSNSVAYTLGRAMGLDLDAVIKNAGVDRKFPGWGRDLLDPKYERYVAPPPFPVRDTP